MSTDELRPIRDRLSQLPELERAYVEAMVLQLLDIENCGPISALDIIVVVSRFVLDTKTGVRPGPKPAFCTVSAPPKKRQNRKQVQITRGENGSK